MMSAITRPNFFLRWSQITEEGRRTHPGNYLALPAIALFSAIPFLMNDLMFISLALWLIVFATATVRCEQATHFALIAAVLATVMQVPALRVLSLPMILSVIVYAVLVMSIAPLRRSVPWFHKGRWELATGAYVAGIAAVSSAALILWHALTAPDLSPVRQMVGGMPFAGLLLVAIALPLVNALVEEIVFRGVMMSALSRVFDGTLVINLIQAVSFGLLHKDGIPNGLSGIALSTIYAFMLGALRQRTRGLFAPWLAHVVADICIFCIVVYMA